MDLIPTSRVIPGVLEIQAAALVGPIIDEQGVSARQLAQQYRTIPTLGLHDRNSLMAGQQLLERLGLIIEREGMLFPHADLQAFRGLAQNLCVELLLERVFQVGAALWLPTFADADEVHWERVPADASYLLTAVFEDSGRREAFVLASARKVDAALLQEIGADGEIAVADGCRKHLVSRGRPDLAELVSRVSLNNDTLGFDVYTPTRQGGKHHLEVKTTRSLANRIGFYLSRNEAIVGEKDQDWKIVIARQVVGSPDAPLRTEIIGWLTFADIAPSLPSDTVAGADLEGRWASTKVTIPERLIRPGLPLD